jgi:hypothetical protein
VRTYLPLCAGKWSGWIEMQGSAVLCAALPTGPQAILVPDKNSTSTQLTARGALA